MPTSTGLGSGRGMRASSRHFPCGFNPGLRRARRVRRSSGAGGSCRRTRSTCRQPNLCGCRARPVAGPHRPGVSCRKAGHHRGQQLEAALRLETGHGLADAAHCRATRDADARAQAEASKRNRGKVRPLGRDCGSGAARQAKASAPRGNPARLTISPAQRRSDEVSARGSPISCRVAAWIRMSATAGGIAFLVVA
jgi:hypothetical protein